MHPVCTCGLCVCVCVFRCLHRTTAVRWRREGGRRNSREKGRETTMTNRTVQTATAVAVANVTVQSLYSGMLYHRFWCAHASTAIRGDLIDGRNVHPLNADFSLISFPSTSFYSSCASLSARFTTINFISYLSLLIRSNLIGSNRSSQCIQCLSYFLLSSPPVPVCVTTRRSVFYDISEVRQERKRTGKLML